LLDATAAVPAAIEPPATARAAVSSKPVNGRPPVLPPLVPNVPLLAVVPEATPLSVVPVDVLPVVPVDVLPVVPVDVLPVVPVDVLPVVPVDVLPVVPVNVLPVV